MKKVTFIRWGGVNYKKQDKNSPAPEKCGIWCFPLGLVDFFYVPQEKRNRHPSKFKFQGYVWINSNYIPRFVLKKILPYQVITQEKVIKWILVDTTQLYKIINICKTLNNRPRRYNQQHQIKIIQKGNKYICSFCGHIQTRQKQFKCECDYRQRFDFECFIPRNQRRKR